jgi:hypothetical protein
MATKETTGARLCPGGSGTKVLSVDEQMRAWTACSWCGRPLNLRKNASGFAAKEALLPRHLPASDAGGEG